MNEAQKKNLGIIMTTLAASRQFDHAAKIVNFDQETICPPKGMADQGEVLAMLENQSFRLTKEPQFTAAVEALYQEKEGLDPLDRALIKHLHRDYSKSKNITPDKNLEFQKIYNQGFVDWINAKKHADFSLFEKSLAKVRDANLEDLSLREYDGEKPKTKYDALFDDYEEGMTEQDLDAAFGAFAERMTPMIREIKTHGKKIRTDFLTREVTDVQQQEMADYLLHLLKFDFERGAWTTTEHPFTDNIGKDDARVTTHYYPTNFLSSMFSIIHECGHALFMQLQPAEDYDHDINDLQTMGMHESVSRFYENRIGRSRAFISLIYPKCCEIFPQVFTDVSEEEFYEAVNVVEPSLVRTEADEFTYTFHIIIRYELEKRIVNGELEVDSELPDKWNTLYEKYLGVTPANDREGILQDVHWASGFGYFPTYAIGNMYNAMYYNRMAQDLNIEETIRAGRFDIINSWMAEHVFKEANRLAPKDWIRQVTGRDFTPEDFLAYLEKKYSALYEI